MSPLERLVWLRLIASTRKVTDAGLRVAIAYAQHANSETGCAWPGRTRLAKETQLEVRSVVRSRKKLVEFGFLQPVRFGGGAQGDTSSYRLVMPAQVTELTRMTHESPVSEVSPVTHATPTSDSPVRERVTDRSPKHGSQPKKKKGTPPVGQKSAEHPLFERWYQAYPLKKGRGQAAKVFSRMNPSAGQVDEMLAAIEVQVAERESRQAQGDFVAAWKYPATWLNGECWLDETDSPERDSPESYAEGAI